MVTTQLVTPDAVRLNVATAGEGPPVLLLHGWPHTWEVWTHVVPGLVAAGRRVIAPDLRGMGASERPEGGYDLPTLVADALGVLDAVGTGGEPTDVVALDLGVPVAFLLAHGRPDRVRRLVVMESLLGALPGAEAFLAGGAPWWFGFHAVPGLAEEVLVGHEAAYVDWFLRSGTAGGRGIDPTIRDAFVAAATGRDALRGGFAHYRELAANGARIAAAVADAPLRVPTTAVAGGVVGDALHRQLVPIAPDLRATTIPDCGHLVPLEQPAALLELLREVL